MALENVMRVDNGNVVTGGGTGGNSVEIDWEDWCKLTPEEQETGDWTIVNCPWADGNVSVDLMTKLWENPNPKSNIAAGTLVNNIETYDLYLVIAKKYSTSTYHKSYLCVVGTNDITAYDAPSDISKGVLIAERALTFGSSVTISDCACQWTGGKNTSNNYIIPTVIYGIKLTATVKINAIAMDVSTSADKCMLSDGETSVGERVEANTLGTAVDITSYTQSNPYVAPSDGYARVVVNYGTAATYGNIRVDDAMINQVWNPANSNGLALGSVYVKKGMTVNVDGTSGKISGQFYPLT